MRTLRFARNVVPGVASVVVLGVVLGAVVGVAFASRAHASPLFELLGASTGTGGLNARAIGTGSPVTYFNPALLPRAEQGVELGLVVLSDQISIDVAGRNGGNVPLGIEDRTWRHEDGTPISVVTVPTRWLYDGCAEYGCGDKGFGARPRQAAGTSGNTRAYQVVGLVNQAVPKRLALGVYAIVPMAEFTTAHSFFNDEREQFFTNSLHPEMYADRLTATSLAFGAGAQILPQLAAGLSFTLNLRNSAQASTYIADPSDYNTIDISTDVRVQTSVSPHAGLVYTPSERITVSGTLHSVQKLTIETGFGATLTDGTESDTERTAVHAYLPWLVTVGGGYLLTDQIAVAGSAQLGLWSGYVDRHGDRPESGEQPGAEDQFAWRDTITTSLGVRYTYNDLQSFVDLSFAPSPVPDQVGRKNYVDNDRLAVSGGSQLDFRIHGLRFRASAQAQVHRLMTRETIKQDAMLAHADELPDDTVDQSGEPVPGREGLQTNNPGWPGYTSAGWILGGTVSLSLLY
jgi:hypothetical protein